MRRKLIEIFTEISVEELLPYLNDSCLQQMREKAQRQLEWEAEHMVTGTGAKPPKQGYIIKVAEGGGFTDEELLANPALLYTKSTEDETQPKD